MKRTLSLMLLSLLAGAAPTQQLHRFSLGKLMSWETYNLPLSGPPDAGSATSADAPAAATTSARRGLFFKGAFTLDNLRRSKELPHWNKDCFPF